MARQYKLARKMKKITLTAAAKDLGVSQPTLSAWESERKNPSIDSLVRMADYYGVTVDFLLGLATEGDPRVDLTRPVAKEALPALHETPVFSRRDGWAFVDAIERVLRTANGRTIPFADAQELFYIPPVFAVGGPGGDPPLEKNVLSEYEQVWVEPISTDADLRQQLRGWYHVKDRFVENEVGQRFYLDFYGAKWLAFSDALENI